MSAVWLKVHNFFYFIDAKTEFDNVSNSIKEPHDGYSHKFNQMARINIGDVVTSIQGARLYGSDN